MSKAEDEQRSPGLDFRIHGGPTEDEIQEGQTPDEPQEADDESLWESEGGSMARKVPPEITEVMQGG